MKRALRLVFMLAITGCLPVIARAQSLNGPYHFEKSIHVPGNGGWDYLAMDTVHRRLFVSHGDQVDVINTVKQTVSSTIKGLQGVHGIAIAYGLNRGFISNGKENAVTAFDLSSLKTIATIPVTGKDPDCIVYDPYSKEVFTFNGDSQNSTVIDAKSLKVVGTISLGGSPEFAVSDGKGKIFNNLEDKNEIVVINTGTKKVTGRYDLTPCGGPSALAMDIADNRVFTACRKNKGVSVLNAASGEIIVTLPIGSGVDAARFDTATKLLFTSNGDGTVTIIHEDAPDKYRKVQTLQTQKGARTMALDPVTHQIYLSVAKRVPGAGRRTAPGTFDVLVYGMK
jgi:YVTN family beta-propeller protein